MHQLTRLSALFLAFGVAIAMPTSALAQEQENPSTPGQIADPSTYQGSTVLQQQSDRQDQEFRQQQQQQQSYGSQGGGQYAPRYSSNSAGAAPLMPANRCILAIPRSPTLQPLRPLVGLAGPDVDPSYFTISRGPTNAEKPLLLKWLAARRHCETLPNGLSPEVQAVNLKATRITDNMILALVRGEGDFGKFNYVRAHNSQVFQNFRQSH
jgi:hypothetical protein